ncbi:patatin-like phospholipase-domain-containing protein [Podospora appendiculata]|uniref:Patatin-like phospholipase-domain-containing protein n=1 Tax=Podospora appendiculata TaxID=314037 RepID=A0AAE1CFR1_9PEZI|nr:patatin-like phospholipase-domain-containing protein [Podospora appendiculata]
MADIVGLQESTRPQPAKPPISALRSSRSVPRRTPARVSIAIPESSFRNNIREVTPSAPVAGIVNSISRTPNHTVTSTPWARKLILTLDGGGIRGYSSLVILRAIMHEIACVEQSVEPGALSSAHTDRIEPDMIPAEVYKKGQYLPCHYFDYIAGTSVGGLIAIMLGILGRSTEDCIAEFHRQNIKAISLTNTHPTVALEFPLLHRRSTWPTKQARSFFDNFTKFSLTSTSKRPLKTTPCPTSSEQEQESPTTGFRKSSLECQTLAWCTEVTSPTSARPRPYAFCTYKEDNNDDDDDDAAASSPSQLLSIPEVAKAITTPATHAFKPFRLGAGQFVDGSKQIRDPTLEVLKELSALLDGGGDMAIDLLLSLGADEHHASWLYDKLLRRSVTARGEEEPWWRRDISKEEGRSYREYHRFEVPDIRLGLRRRKFLGEIEAATERWLRDERQRERVRRYAEVLVERRRERAGTARWETFALGVRYYCFHEGCRHGAGAGFGSRGDFYDHLDQSHDVLRLAARSMVDVEEELDRGRKFGCS